MFAMHIHNPYKPTIPCLSIVGRVVRNSPLRLTTIAPSKVFYKESWACKDYECA